MSEIEYFLSSPGSTTTNGMDIDFWSTQSEPGHSGSISDATDYSDSVFNRQSIPRTTLDSLSSDLVSVVTKIVLARRIVIIAGSVMSEALHLPVGVFVTVVTTETVNRSMKICRISLMTLTYALRRPSAL